MITMVFPLLQHVPYDNKYYTSKTGLIIQALLIHGPQVHFRRCLKTFFSNGSRVQYPQLHIFSYIYHKMNNLLNKISLQIHFPSEMISSSEFFCSHYTEKVSTVLVHNGWYDKSCTVARQQSFHHLHLLGQFLKERQTLN